jgi:hypothetical protein
VAAYGEISMAAVTLGPRTSESSGQSFSPAGITGQPARLRHAGCSKRSIRLVRKPARPFANSSPVDAVRESRHDRWPRVRRRLAPRSRT